MEVSVVGCSQTSVGRSELLHRKVGLCNSRLIWPKSSRIRFDPNRRWKRGFLAVALKTIRAEVSRSETVWGERSSGRTYATKSGDRIQLYVGLPIDTVSSCNNLNHTRAIAAGLKALKLLGVQGVEFPLWWGVVENEAHGKYNWSAYLALAQMVRDAGLKLRVMLCFHALATPAAPLPQWVSRIGDTNPDIFFADKSGRRYKECLSLSVDDLPVLDGKTPMQVYEDFLQSFKSSFSDFMGSTVTDISVGLGPDGELRYPSFPMSTKSNEILGVGEFQCYDKHMLDSLKQQAQTSRNPLWGLSGPHDTPAYNQSPESNSFFRENGGSWETPYGDFFLSWYSSQLLSHGERLLSLASSTFSDSPVTVSGKIPQMHSWYKTRSHPSELTAGYYNTANRDGYDDVAEMFARNSCRMILPGLDLSNKDQPDAANSSPDSLLSQIMVACSKHGVQISGENFALSSSQASFRNIKGRLFSSLSVDQFTYQRMGAYFFSPDHFPLFTEFVRSLYQAELDMDDRPSDKEETIPFTTTPSDSEKNLQMQAA